MGLKCMSKECTEKSPREKWRQSDEETKKKEWGGAITWKIKRPGLDNLLWHTWGNTSFRVYRPCCRPSRFSGSAKHLGRVPPWSQSGLQPCLWVIIDNCISNGLNPNTGFDTYTPLSYVFSVRGDRITESLYNANKQKRNKEKWEHYKNHNGQIQLLCFHLSLAPLWRITNYRKTQKKFNPPQGPDRQKQTEVVLTAHL